MQIAKLRLAIVLLLAAPAGSAAAVVHVVQLGDSIQTAVDGASPGDTILVQPGVYSAASGARSVVNITTDNLTLIGSLGAVINGIGAEYGVLVGPDLPRHGGGCPAKPAVNRFRMRGFTFSRGAYAGAELVGVEDYRLSHGFYLDNGEHAAVLACSRHGRVDHNFASGHRGASFRAADTDTLRIDHNILKHSGLGVEIGNSLNSVVSDNWMTDNSGGVLVIARPGRALPFAENVSIEHNWIAENNRAADDDELLAGAGILNVGGDDVLIRENTVIGNASFGIASFANPYGDLDPRLEVFVDGLVVKRNIAKGNADAPDRALVTPGADLIFVPDVLDLESGHRLEIDPDPADNCFAGNHIDSDLPSGVAHRFACP